MLSYKTLRDMNINIRAKSIAAQVATAATVPMPLVGHQSGSHVAETLAKSQTISMKLHRQTVGILTMLEFLLHYPPQCCPVNQASRWSLSKFI